MKYTPVAASPMAINQIKISKNCGMAYLTTTIKSATTM